MNYFLQRSWYLLQCCLVFLFLTLPPHGNACRELNKVRTSLSGCKPCQKTSGTEKKQTAAQAEASQKKADMFVLNHWAKAHPNAQHHLKVSASEELNHLQSAYWKKCLAQCDKDGQLFPICPFNVKQVYSAYYRAVSAERSLFANLITP
jgi:hypothetical protein